MWWSGLLSDVGTWMQVVAVGALTTELTDSAAWGSLVAAVTYLAMGLLTPFGGVFADHHDRRWLMFLAAMLQFLLALTLTIAYVSDFVSPVFIVAVVACEGALVALAMPTRSALLPQLIGGKAELGNATALGAASWNLGRTVGPGLAGLVIASGSYTWVFAMNAVTFLATAVAVTLLRLDGQVKPTGDEKPLDRLRAGFTAARADPGCWVAIKMIAFGALTIAPFIALIPAMAQIVFGGTALDTSHMVMAQGVGAVAGTIFLATLAERIGRARVLKATLIVLPVVELGYALAPSIGFAIVMLGLTGVAYVGLLVGLNTLVQLRAPEHFRGRIISLYVTSLSLFYPVGAMIQGILGDIVGVREVLATGAIIFFVVAVGALLLRPRLFDGLDYVRAQ